MFFPRALLALLACSLIWSAGLGCSCGDDDDDGSGSPPDDDADDDDADDDDDVADDDDVDDDANDDDLGSEAGCVVPVDYDGDGDAELLMSSENFTEDRFALYFAEPGTFERTPVLTLENVQTGEGGTRYEAGDFDGDGVWDVLLAAPNADTGLTTFLIYAGGDFSEPLFESDPIDASLYMFGVFDEKGDGYPDFLTHCNNCGGDEGILLFRNEGGSVTQGPLLTDEGDGYTVWMAERVPGSVYPRSSNVTGETGATQIVTYREWDDGGTEWSRFYVYDIETGALVTSTDPVDAGEGNGWSDGRVGDFDGDGRTELIHALTYSDSGVPVLEATFTVYGYDGGDNVVEYSDAPFADSYAYIEYEIIDADGDGILDPFLKPNESGGADNWLVLNGPDGYSERFTFTVAPPFTAYFAHWLRRGRTARGYVMGGGLDPSLAAVYRFADAGTTTGLITLVSMLDGSETTELASFPLGESGQAYQDAADLGGDGVMDVFVLAQESYWDGGDWDYVHRVYLFNGEMMDEAYSAEVTTAFDYPPWMTLEYDFTGDRVPDPAVVGDVGGEQRLLVFPCDSTGCEAPASIESGDPDEYITFGGPFL